MRSSLSQPLVDAPAAAVQTLQGCKDLSSSPRAWKGSLRGRGTDSAQKGKFTQKVGMSPCRGRGEPQVWFLFPRVHVRMMILEQKRMRQG